MQFVAGVSHELRTPLAVICSAGDNLADGVVEETEQVRKYGALIRDEGRRLAGMVEQTLQFAAVESGRKRYDLQPVDVGNVIETTLAEAEPMIQAAGFAVEKTIEAKLPLAKADASALSQCIQNLITNALKYGLENRWMGVRAAAVTGARGPEVRITVEDKGAGIEPADLPHIFEPFYQGRAAGRAKSPGAGLGLSLAKDAMEAMGGSISVKGAPGEGSSFSLHLPALGRDRTE
jgi:signal transduction histidine kinase